jgi:hypothetical protein
MKRTPLEQLYVNLNSPRWFWPAVLFVLFLLFIFAGSITA